MCKHALVDCPKAREALKTSYEELNLAEMPKDNSSGDFILWTLTGKVLGPSRTNSNPSLVNAMMWLNSIEILKARFKKETSNGILMSQNVKKTLTRLCRKD